ncbi:NAD(P)-dependent oxidoreductase [Pseudomonas sp. HR96]|uniref:NAD(P)-dependent oxidoreductase n=1 Tax=Pseudomonas sp. HR96 TaxID=1027966 RepID=UPI002A74D5DD|nr:NAD(P)-dependent oxidoreductase [Pseudomonas sp. HR96]WPO97667.1 NAD(P)-dependent oxidoreductase [Pseudomonas sp. HR96]
MKVGLIGLGNMGSAIALNLIKAGHKVSVWNRSRDKADALLQAGATWAASPAEAGEAEVVLSMLADDTALQAVVFGAADPQGNPLPGTLQSKAPALHLSLSTISIELADRLAQSHAEAGRGFVSAPVFGRPAAAQAAKLFIAAAGNPAHLALCEPLFDAISQRVFTIGERPSMANVVKLSGNFMIMAAVEAMAEAMTLCEKSGVAKSTLFDVLTNTLFNAPVYKTYGEILVQGRYRPAGFAAPLGLKDMTLVSSAAQRSGTPMPVLGVVRDHLIETIACEGEDIDWSGVGITVAKHAGL